MVLLHACGFSLIRPTLTWPMYHLVPRVHDMCMCAHVYTISTGARVQGIECLCVQMSDTMLGLHILSPLVQYQQPPDC